MTIVEFFDKAPIENMVSCLTVKPDKIIFIGDENKSRCQIEAYEKFLKQKGINTRLEFANVDKYNIESIVARLEKIVESENDCIFDLTGGDELMLVSMGIVCGKHRDKTIKIHKFIIPTGRILDCDDDNEVAFSGIPQISVNDQITLHGGTVVSFSHLAKNADKQLQTDISTLWNACKSDPAEWNSSVANLTEFEKYKAHSENPLEITLNLNSIRNMVKQYGEKLHRVNEFLKSLKRQEMLSYLDFSSDKICYTYKNERIKQCLSKAGNVLELKTFLTAKSVTDGNESMYTDAACSVVIGWDDDAIPSNDTRNEIDVLLMRGLVPVFISCKNGFVEEEELYKLGTVASHFGGGYAKKVLVATNIERAGHNVVSFKRRAADMGIILIDNVMEMTDEEFACKLKNI